MRVADFVNNIQQRIREGMNFIHHPQEILWQQGQRRADDWYKNLEVGTETISHQAETSTVNYPSSNLTNPPLEIGAKLASSRWDSYTIESCLKTEGGVCLYLGKNSNDELMLVKEYRLEALGFPQKNIKKCQEEFLQVIELNLKIGHGPDFRLVKIVEAIAKENNCYLITKYIRNSISLRQYLEQHGAMTAKPIREVIKQVLETLQFLHAYRVRFSADKLERGLPHGNINLNSLIFKQAASSVVADERQFFIYLSDLALWENLFSPPNPQLPQPFSAKNCQSFGSISQDLKDLGLVGFLLAGGKVNENLQLSEFESAPIWSGLKDYELKKFIQRLLGFISPFQTAEEALDALIKLPENSTHPVTLLPVTQSVDVSPILVVKHPKIPPNILLLSLLFITPLFLLIWMHLPKNIKSEPITSISETGKTNCCIKDISNKNYTYMIESKSGWQTANQISIWDSESMNFSGKTNIFDVLNSRGGFKITRLLSVLNQQPKKKLDREVQKKSAKLLPKSNQSQDENIRNFESRENAFKQLNNKKVDFALMTLPDQSEVEKKGLDSKIVAYDALVILVAFRVNDPSQATAAQKLEGQITLDQLRKVYTGERVEINGYILKPILPEKETVEIFKKLAFYNEPEYEQKFESFKIKHKAEQYNFSTLYAKILENSQDENKHTILIGFDRLSKTLGNCSVYPLAIVDNNNNKLQVLEKSNHTPITPNNVDLCGDKGSYWSNPNILKPENYPLAYQLGVVFNKDSPGKDFAQALTTTEGQYLLSRIGLVPLSPIPEIQQELWQQQESKQ